MVLFVVSFIQFSASKPVQLAYVHFVERQVVTGLSEKDYS